MVHESIVQSVSFLRKKISYEHACEWIKHFKYEYSKIITTSKCFTFIQWKSHKAKKRFNSYEKITYSYSNGVYIVQYMNEQPKFIGEEDTEKKCEIPLEMKPTIQSILIPRERFSLDDAISFVKKYYKYKKVDITPKYYRFRQYQPKYLRNTLDLNNVMTSTNKETGIKLIIFYRADLRMSKVEDDM